MSNRAPRLPAEARRQDIVRHAAELFAAKGFRGTTTKEIAEACGVSEATIFRHFATKDELYDDIIREYMGSLREAEAHFQGLTEDLPTDDPQAFFTKFAARFLRHHSEHPVFLRLLVYSGLEDHALASRFFSTYVREARATLIEVIRRFQADGTFRDVDPAVATTALIGLLVHHVNATEIFKLHEEWQVSHETDAVRLVDIFLNGMWSTSR